MKKTVSESITITDYSDEILKQLGEAKELILESIGPTMEGFAKMYETAIQTGRLRNSITWATSKDAGKQFAFEYEVEENGQKVRKSTGYKLGDTGDADAVYVGTNVEYAPKIEYGGGKGGRGKHFLEKALKNHKDTYSSIIKKYLDQP